MTYMSLKAREIFKDCYLVTSPSQFEITNAFIRPQEFYESDLPSIKGKQFTLEDLMVAYAERHGNFTYFTDWKGFNIPSHSFRKWREVNTGAIRFSEYNLYYALDDAGLSLTPSEFNLSSENTIPNQNYYIIGVQEDNTTTINHEIAHAMYYLNTI